MMFTSQRGLQPWAADLSQAERRALSETKQDHPDERVGHGCYEQADVSSSAATEMTRRPWVGRHITSTGTVKVVINPVRFEPLESDRTPVKSTCQVDVIAVYRVRRRRHPAG